MIEDIYPNIPNYTRWMNNRLWPVNDLSSPQNYHFFVTLRYFLLIFSWSVFFLVVGRVPGTEMADRSRKWAREEFATYTYILIDIALSSGQIFFNKVISSLLFFSFLHLLRCTFICNSRVDNLVLLISTLSNK